jgi:acyl-coenzyme A synthetase/AMP-(fatty) acid ligase
VDGASVGAAFVVVRPDADVTPGELLAHARAGLAPHQVPVSLAIVDGLPRNEVGKLVRTELARLAGGRDPGPRVRPRPDGS